MARLIDTNALLKEKTFLWDEALGFCECVLVDDIVKAPTVDAVEVVHGRWMPKLESVWNLERPVLCGCTCSVCNTTWDAETNYCPNCGAKMDGDGNG